MNNDQVPMTNESTSKPLNAPREKADRQLLQQQSAGSSYCFVEWLLACPEKDWFQCIPSELTADQSRSNENR
jgi:hypothetical protein